MDPLRCTLYWDSGEPVLRTRKSRESIVAKDKRSFGQSEGKLWSKMGEKFRKRIQHVPRRRRNETGSPFQGSQPIVSSQQTPGQGRTEHIAVPMTEQRSPSQSQFKRKPCARCMKAGGESDAGKKCLRAKTSAFSNQHTIRRIPKERRQEKKGTAGGQSPLKKDESDRSRQYSSISQLGHQKLVEDAKRGWLKAGQGRKDIQNTTSEEEKRENKESVNCSNAKPIENQLPGGTQKR